MTVRPTLISAAILLSPHLQRLEGIEIMHLTSLTSHITKDHLTLNCKVTTVKSNAKFTENATEIREFI